MRMIHFLLLVWLYCTFNSLSVNGNEASGTVTCNGQPLPYVKINFMKKPLFWFASKTGSTRTWNNGYFWLKVKKIKFRPKLFIQVEYEYSGYLGKIAVENFLGQTRKEKTAKRSYDSHINFGTINFNSIHCKSYVRFYKALSDYRNRSGRKPPYKSLGIRTKVVLHGGTPYATLNVVRIPIGTQDISFKTAKHELAHTVRQSYDGSMFHFLIDVARYTYMQNHYCGKKTNKGFAFNEGWAQFWAGQCYSGPYGGSKYDYNYEGNVAEALRRLKKRCNLSYRKMVDVLRLAGTEKIHSFEEYKKECFKRHPSCSYFAFRIAAII